MKKVMFFGLMVMVSVMVFGTSAAEERVKTDNMIAGVAQESLATEQTSAETEGVLIAKLEMEIEYDPALCNQLAKECKDASSAGEPSICDYFTATNCPNHF